MLAAVQDRERPNLFGLDREGLTEFLAPYGVPPFRARQVFRWIYRRSTFDAAAWTDLPLALRARLGAEAAVHPGVLVARVEAPDGTVKYRVDLAGGGAVESVCMVHAGRVTLCVSSQSGCALACDFCLTGKMGLSRHLTTGEIVGQVALMTNEKRLSEPFNLVFMGMGEPLHNYDAVLGAVRLLADPEAFGLSRRRITVSTVGLVPAIERLAGEPLRPRLAVSLNATTDEVRSRIMPVNRRYPIARLLDACSAFVRSTGERMTFEYVLLAGVNDGDEDAARLARLARGVPAKVNLIPFNAVPGWLAYRPTPRPRVLAFRDHLLAEGAAASIRWSRGTDSRAGCGQLALLPAAPPSDTGTAEAAR